MAMKDVTNKKWDPVTILIIVILTLLVIWFITMVIG